MALESSILSPPKFIYGAKSLSFSHSNRPIKLPLKGLPESNRIPFRLRSNCVPSGGFGSFFGSTYQGNDLFVDRASLKSVGENSESSSNKNGSFGLNFELFWEFLKHGVVLTAMVCGVFVFGCKSAFAVEAVVNAGYGVIGQSILLLRNARPKTLLVLQVFKEQGLVLAVLLGLSVFFSMAETAITTLWHWKCCQYWSYCFSH